jgi:hypothetical protein
MAPQLMQQPPEQYGHGYQVPDETPYTPANPGLMATYRRGVRAAEAAESGGSGGTAGSTGSAGATDEQAPYSDGYSAE